MRVTKAPEERKAELISAARQLFDKKGVDKTRVSDIVHHVGVAQGAFYYYFTSKDEIVTAVVQQVTRELAQKTDAILADSESDFCARLAAFIELYLQTIDQFLADDEQNLAAFEAEMHREDTLAAQMQQLLLERLQTLIGLGAQQGSITIDYPWETAQVLVYGLRRYAAQRLPGRAMLYTIVEQALSLPKGGLVQYAGANKK